MRYSSEYLSGNVVDLGAGCAKIAPYLANNDDITSYIEIDASRVMCKQGEKLLNKLEKENFGIKECYIESHKPENMLYDSAVSINSLYTWTSPLEVLKHINSLICQNGTLVLATINNKLDMDFLMKNVEADLILHPDFDKFKAINLQLANNSKANVLTLDELITLSHEAGFIIREVKKYFYEGGLNLLVLTKT